MAFANVAVYTVAVLIALAWSDVPSQMHNSLSKDSSLTDQVWPCFEHATLLEMPYQITFNTMILVTLLEDDAAVIMTLLVGVAGYGTQICMTYALKYSKAAPALAMSYLSVVWGLLGGFFFFHEVSC